VHLDNSHQGFLFVPQFRKQDGSAKNFLKLVQDEGCLTTPGNLGESQPIKKSGHRTLTIE
jgi:hypothetical protein